MIKTNELMTGDWVYMEANRGYEAQYIQVETIPDASAEDHYGHIGAFPVGGDNDFRDIEDKHLFPIPLTPEILEKNGWDWNGEIWINTDILFAIENGYDREIRYWWHMFNSPIVRINYVHELQHALRLCEIKKEIKL